MKYFEQLSLLKNIKGIGLAAINKKYLDLIPSYPDIYSFAEFVAEKESISEFEKETAVQKSREELDLLEKDERLSVITCFDSEYPTRFNLLGNQRPVYFYIKGDKEILDHDTIAVIGTRKPSIFGVSAGKKLVRQLDDVVIVSGLALGTDRIAHETAIEAGTKTIAVLPSGLHTITPASNKKLADIISEGNGCIISEYSPNEAAAQYTYVRRDALVAALSDGILVIECGVKSGTMHTVESAIKMRKPIYCYYTDRGGDYSGNKKLIEEKKASTLSKPEDIRNLVDLIRNKQLDLLANLED